MKTQAFEIGTDDHPFHAVEVDGAIARWRKGEGPFWIDVAGGDSEAKVQLLADVGVDGSVTNELLESGHSGRVLPLEHGLFFEFPSQMSAEAPELKSTSVVCLERLVVTLRELAPPRPDGFPSTKLPGLGFVAHSAEDLVCALLIESTLHLRAATSDIRRKALAISNRLDQDPDTVTIEEILALKHDVIDLDAVGEERAAVLETLGSFKTPKVDLTRSDGFRVAVGNTAAIVRRIDRIDRRVVDLQSRYDVNQQDKTNRRLSRLTIISAIFLPLTLLAGIYGMNFDFMPELHYDLGYPLVLGGMAVIALSLLWWFRTRGWME